MLTTNALVRAQLHSLRMQLIDKAMFRCQSAFSYLQLNGRCAKLLSIGILNYFGNAYAYACRYVHLILADLAIFGIARKLDIGVD